MDGGKTRERGGWTSAHFAFLWMGLVGLGMALALGWPG